MPSRRLIPGVQVASACSASIPLTAFFRCGFGGNLRRVSTERYRERALSECTSSFNVSVVNARVLACAETAP